MMYKRRRYKFETIDWKKLLGKKEAWTAQELAPKLGLSPITVRRLLRTAANIGLLEVKQVGRYKYYALVTENTEQKLEKEQE